MLLVRRARVPVALLPASMVSDPIDPLEPAQLCDITIAGNAITAVSPASASAPLPDSDSSATVIDVAGALVIPAFVDAHVHLDKTHTWHRAPNRSATFMDALESLHRDSVNWTEADLLRRARFALRCAWAHGTRAIRTHLDTGPLSEISHATMAALRTEWRGRITLQTVPLGGGPAYATSDGERIADLALRHGATALGGFFTMSAELPTQLDRLLAIARDRGVGIDLHVDENGDANAEVLRHVAEAVLRSEFPFPVICGHCCSLATQPIERARSTIALVKAARIGIISLPLCNLYLQDRRGAGNDFPRSPLWRGLTLIRDFLDAGVPVACASDNVRDAFYAFGDYNLAEVYTQSVRLAHLDGPGLCDSINVVTRTAADLIGLPDLGHIAPGARAHLNVFSTHRFSELLSRPDAARRCIDGESVHQPTLPDFSELQDRSA